MHLLDSFIFMSSLLTFFPRLLMFSPTSARRSVASDVLSIVSLEWTQSILHTFVNLKQPL